MSDAARLPAGGRSRRLRAAWLAVAILITAYAINYLDRQVVSLLVEPLKHDLHLNDSQIGLLQGVGFGIFYTLLGLPCGWLADRTHRVRLVACGIALWSVMTIACGLASSFGWLFVARMGVGVGEASLVPAAISLLADLFEPAELALPIAVFNGGVSIGAGLALVLGGTMIAFAAHGASGLPLIGAWLAGLHPWQTVFLMTGAAGLPICIAVLLIAEPARRSGSIPDAVRGSVSVLTHLLAHRALFTKLLLGAGILFILTNAVLAWCPSILARGFGWKPAAIGAALGIPIMACGLTGIVSGGFTAQFLARRAPAEASLRVMSLGALFLLVPIAAIAPLAPDASLAVAGIPLIFFAGSFTFGVMSAVFVVITPERLRGQMVAISLLFGNVLGLGLGPYSVGFLLDHVFHNPARVGLALSIVALAAGLPGALLLCAARRGYRALATSLISGRPERPGLDTTPGQGSLSCSSAS
jgi:MFS family permease